MDKLPFALQRVTAPAVIPNFRCETTGSKSISGPVGIQLNNKEKASNYGF